MAVSRLHPSPPPPTQHQHQQHHHHHIASTLMSCVRESSPVEELEEAAEDSAECGAGGGVGGGGGGGAEGRKQGRHETKKRRFHPLRGLRRIFRRKSRRSPEDGDRNVLPQPPAVASSSSYGPGGGGTLTREEGRESGGTAAVPAYGDLDEAYRSRSASELLSGEEEEEDEDEGEGSGRRRGSGGIASGEIFQDSLRHSVSHDSVFSSGERRVSSGGGGGGGGGGRPAQPLAPSSSAQQVAANQGVRAELFDAVRRRRWRSRSKDREEENDADRETAEAAAAGRSSDDEEDLGLPRSPCNSPSSGEAGLRSDQKEIQSKSHSTCSEGSLLSMGSSDMDEDSQGHFSGHSSKLSLHEKSSSQYGSDLELDVGATAEPLSHSAARHKMSIRPKRTHGAPRLRRLKEVTSLGSLPTTPEVNEDSGRCSSPEISFNQETFSTEHIQVPSDKPASTLPAVETPQRVSQGRQIATSPKSDAPPSCLPESFSSSQPNTYVHPTSDSEKGVDKELDYVEDGPYVQQTKLETSSSMNAPESVGLSDSDNGSVEEAVGMEESDGGSTTLLSRLLSWRGSKKKMDEPPEATAAAPAEGTPSRRMDVHGRYVHEVICEGEVAPPGGMDQPPPSPGWRPPFSTSWPPLHHSTPRSCHSSSRYISTGRGNEYPEEIASPDWTADFSGPHSLPLMMQYETMEKSVTEERIEERQVPAAFSVKSRGRSSDEVDEVILNTSRFKVHRQDRQHLFASSEEPESLPMRFDRSAFEPDQPMPSTESLVKVDTKEVVPSEKEVPRRETFLMTSVEGLLTLDLSGPSEMKMFDASEEESSGDFDADTGGPELGPHEEWEESHREAEEVIHFNSCIAVPEDGNVDSLESKVMLHHTKSGLADGSFQRQKSDEFVKIDGAYEPSSQRIVDVQPEDQIAPVAFTPPSAQRYKRTQSMPLGTPSTQPSDVPEFLKVQLIHVDSRPATNVVLHSTGGVPVSVNPPEPSDVSSRRRLRPRSADSLDGNLSGSRELLISVQPAGKSRTADSFVAADNEKTGGAAKEKEVSKEGKCKVSTWEPVGRLNQSEDNRPKETSLPRSAQQKLPEDTAEKVASVSRTPTKEKAEPAEQFHKALTRECSEISIQMEDSRPKESSTPLRTQRKVSEDSTPKMATSTVAVTSMKDREESKFKVAVRESLVTVAVQNNENRPKDASLPPKGQRKTSEDSNAEVVSRRKSTPSKDIASQNKDDEPELFKVFARRSLKLKDSETWESHPPAQQQKSRDSDKENEGGENVVDVVILPIAKDQKQRESLVKSEFLKEIDPQVKSSVSEGHPQMQRISSSNGLLPSSSNINIQSVYGGEKVVESTKVHRSSVGGSLPRREGPSPEKRARGVSVNLPPESHSFRVEPNRGAAVSGVEVRRPLWATQIQSDESYGKPVSGDVVDQTIDLSFRGEDEVKPHFKRIQQRKEEWELRARMQ